MPPETLRTSLVDLEDRMMRYYGVAGIIGAAMVPDVRPVVLAGDLMGPGNSTVRGRRFAWNIQRGAAVIGAPNAWNMKFGADAIVENVVIHGHAIAASNWIKFKVMDQTDAALASAYGANLAFWKERPTASGSGNLPPVVTDNAAGVAVVAVGWEIGGYGLAGAAPLPAPCVIPIDAFVPSGGGFALVLNVAATLTMVATINCRLY